VAVARPTFWERLTHRVDSLRRGGERDDRSRGCNVEELHPKH
jgi:hypothetical protein